MSNKKVLLSMARGELTKQLAALSPVLRNSSLLILSHIRIVGSEDHLTLTATDLDHTIRLSLPQGIGDKGAACVPGKRLADVVAACPPDVVELSTAGQKVVARAGRMKFECGTLDPEEFPELPFLDDWTPVTVSGTQLSRAFRRVIQHVSREESRPILNGICLEGMPDGIAIVATNGHRLFYTQMEGPEMPARQWIVTGTTAALLTKLFGDAEAIQFRAAKEHVQFSTASVTLLARLIEGPYPGFRNFIPSSGPINATVDRIALEAAVKRALAPGHEGFSLIALAWTNGSLLVSSQTEYGIVEDELTAKVEGLKGSEAFRVGVSGPYLLDLLASVGGESVLLSMSTPKRAIRITDAATADGPDVGVLMPLRLVEGEKKNAA